MRVLLDTCTFLWMDGQTERISKSALKVITDSSTTRLLSYASIWEMSIKYSMGKLAVRHSVEELVQLYVAERIIELLPIEPRDLYTVSKLSWVHKDPFDRLLVSQSLVHQLPLVTSDERVSGYGIPIIW